MAKIRYLIMDVDGTMTDGKIYMGADGEVFKAFHVKDGYGIAKLLPLLQIEPVVITGRNSIIVENRCKELGIKYIFQGIENKIDFMKEWLGEKGISANEIAYVGDDDNDLEGMIFLKKNGGVIGCPADASRNVVQIVDYVGKKKGGQAFVREFIEDVLMKYN